MIEAYITNLGRYNEGYLDCEPLKLPATKEDVQALLSRIGVDGVMYEEFFITDYAVDVSIFGLKEHLGETESIDELNHLASLLDDMDKWELEKFEAAMACGEFTGSVKDLINLTQNLECYDLIPDISDHDDLGRYVAEELEGREIPDWIEGYFDYDGYGRDFDINIGGKFIDGNYAHFNHSAFFVFYNGRDIPEEHKIFAYPKPEKSIKQALANYAQKISEATALNPERPLANESRPLHESR